MAKSFAAALPLSFRLAAPAEAAPALAAAALVAVLAAFTAAQGGGALIYSLDDPYIHLAMAEQILAGGYGVNPGEAASASSSILYPVLLAGLMALGFGELAPLAVTLAASAALAGLTVATWRAFGLRPPAAPRLRGWALTGVALLGLNFGGLALTGMEHSLQAALAMAALLGAASFVRTGRAALWWVFVLGLQPLVRFEGVAICVAGAILLAWRGAPLWAVATPPALSVGTLAGFAAFLTSLGLPPLPSSVLVKGEGVATASGFLDRLAGVAGNLAENVASGPGLVLAAAGGAFLWRFLRAGPAAERGVAGFTAFVTFAHLALGQIGWAERYQAYVTILAFATLPMAFPGLVAWLFTARPARFAAVLALGLALLQNTVLATLQSAAGSANVRLQQAEMARAAREVAGGPVAVNDLGLVALRNEAYVLDLYGLGSEAARTARAAAQGPEWMNRMAQARGVRLAMLYEAWFPQRPAGWVKLGELRLEGRAVTVFDDAVAFYATDRAHAVALRPALEAFAATLPRGAIFVFEDSADRR